MQQMQQVKSCGQFEVGIRQRRTATWFDSGGGKRIVSDYLLI